MPIEKQSADKFDEKKVRVELVTSQFIIEIAKVLTEGAIKYSDHNWRKGLQWSRVYGATMRHLLAWNKGETIDPETGLSHLSHAATNIMFLLEYSNTCQNKDDRYIPREIGIDIAPGKDETRVIHINRVK